MNQADDAFDPAQPGPYSPDLGDWRAAKATWILATNGEPVREATAAHQLSLLVTPQLVTKFRTPSAAALHLNSAWKAARRAEDARARIMWHSSPPRFAQVGLAQPVQRSVLDASVPALFDFFEETMLCAISSFASIEAFCNVTLVEKVSQPKEVRRRKEKVLMTAEQMERSLTTEEKLKRQVPDALGVPSPAGKPVWEQFVRLKGVRDSVAHFKRHDQARSFDAVSEPTALHALLELDSFDLPEIAQEVIRHFHPTEPPRWLNNPAWVRPADGGGQVGERQVPTPESQ
jgi:hypothetical protein